MKFYKDADQKNVAANILYTYYINDNKRHLLKKELPSCEEIMELVGTSIPYDESVIDYIVNFVKQYGVKEDELVSIVFCNYFVKRDRSGSSEFYKIVSYNYNDDLGLHYVNDSGAYKYVGVPENFEYPYPA